VPFPVVWCEVDVGSGRVGLYCPESPDSLLDALTDEQFARTDERMPYYALVWPSAKALAAPVLSPDVLEDGEWRGARVLDLGCGLGLVGLAALSRGARVTFLDWEPTALRLAEASARASGLVGGTFVAADWRSPPPLPSFDRILGADVLYEHRNAPGVAAFLARHLAPDGEAWIVDPGRRHAAQFEDHLASVGLTVLEERDLPPRDEVKQPRLFRIGHAADPRAPRYPRAP
jgi:predicted nicotinamide N-methyase